MTLGDVPAVIRHLEEAIAAEPLMRRGEISWSYYHCCRTEAPRPGNHKAGCPAKEMGP